MAAGSTVSGYRIEGLLGRGGMGAVYRATQVSLNRQVALKILAPHLAEDARFRERFLREAQTQARLEHPSIVPIYETGESELGPFISMRLVPGTDLKALILEAALPAPRALTILRQVASALDHAHTEGLIHRDVKPQNILVSHDDRAFLADFGLTKPLDAASLTDPGQFLGSHDYVSPEQIRGRTLSPKSDLYSLGAVIYECLTGSVPYPRDSSTAVIFAHVSDPLPAPTSVNPLLPAAVDAPIMAVLAKEASDRPATALDVIASIEAAAAGSLPTVAPPAVLRGEELPRAESSTPATARAHPVDRDHTRLDPAPGLRPPAPPADPRQRWWTVPRIGLAGAGLLVFAVGGFLATRQLLGPTPAPRTQLVSSGGIALAVPGSWHRAPATTRMNGMVLTSPIRVETNDERAPASLTAGWVKSESETLLPPQAASTLTTTLGTRRVARLGSVLAYSYRGNERNLVAFFVRTTRADKTLSIVCENPLRGTASLRSCESIAATVRLSGVTPLPPTPSASYATAVNRALRAIADTRDAQLARMRTASTARVQAGAARAISAAYAAGARGVRTAPTGGDRRLVDATADIVGALEAAARAYDRLGAAAAVGDPAPFRRSAVAAVAADAQVRSRVAAVARLGYRVRG